MTSAAPAASHVIPLELGRELCVAVVFGAGPVGFGFVTGAFVARAAAALKRAAHAAA